MVIIIIFTKIYIYLSIHKNIHFSTQLIIKHTEKTDLKTVKVSKKMNEFSLYSKEKKLIFYHIGLSYRTIHLIQG